MADDLDFDAPSVDQFMDEDEVQRPPARMVPPPRGRPKVRGRPTRQPDDEEEFEEQLPPAPQQRRPAPQRPQYEQPQPQQYEPQQQAFTPAPAPVQPQYAQPQQAYAPAPAPVQQAPAVQAPTPDAIVPYEIPKRIGFYNRNLNKAIVEDEDMLRVIMASQAEILNRLERIEAALS